MTSHSRRTSLIHVSWCHRHASASRTPTPLTVIASDSHVGGHDGHAGPLLLAVLERVGAVQVHLSSNDVTSETTQRLAYSLGPCRTSIRDESSKRPCNHLMGHNGEAGASPITSTMGSTLGAFRIS